MKADDIPRDVISDFLRNNEPNPDANPDEVNLKDFIRFGDVTLTQRNYTKETYGHEDGEAPVWVGAVSFDWLAGIRSTVLQSFEKPSKGDALMELGDMVYKLRCDIEERLNRLVEIEADIDRYLASNKAMAELTEQAQADGEYDPKPAA